MSGETNMEYSGRTRDLREDVGRHFTLMTSHREQIRAGRPLTADGIALQLSVVGW